MALSYRPLVLRSVEHRLLSGVVLHVALVAGVVAAPLHATKGKRWKVVAGAARWAGDGLEAAAALPSGIAAAVCCLGLALNAAELRASHDQWITEAGTSTAIAKTVEAQPGVLEDILLPVVCFVVLPGLMVIRLLATAPAAKSAQRQAPVRARGEGDGLYKAAALGDRMDAALVVAALRAAGNSLEAQAMMMLGDHGAYTCAPAANTAT